MARAAMILLGAALSASTGHAQQSQPPAVKVGAAGVIIDVSVLDRRGQPVLDLGAADFELSEDGKRQQLVSVTLVNGGVAPSVESGVAAERSAAASVDLPSSAGSHGADTTPTVTAILFDKLSPDAMPYAVRAALACVASLMPARDYAGVFLADMNLRSIQPFTRDRARLEAAIAQTAKMPTANFRPEQGAPADHFIQKFDHGTPPTAGADSSRGFTTPTDRQRFLKSLHPADRMMAEMMWRMEQQYRSVLVEYEGEASIASLRAVVDALALATGRKSILYFSEHLPVTDRLKPRFDAIIGRANRANITFYPVDAAGLRLHSKEAEVAREVNLAGAQGIGDVPRDSGAWTKELERQNRLLESRPGAVLGRLAKETGGFLIDNTNDLAAGVARMQQERATYYLLGYEPANAAMDGKFRRVTVRVKRRDVTVRARPGYLAIPTDAADGGEGPGGETAR